VQAVEPGLWSKYGGLNIDSHDYVYANVETRPLFSALLLNPRLWPSDILAFTQAARADRLLCMSRMVAWLSYYCKAGSQSGSFLSEMASGVLVIRADGFYQAATIQRGYHLEWDRLPFPGQHTRHANKEELGGKNGERWSP